MPHTSRWTHSCFDADLRGSHTDRLSKHHWSGRRKACVNVTDPRRSRTPRETIVGQTQMPQVELYNWIFPPRPLQPSAKHARFVLGEHLFWELVWLSLCYVLIRKSGYNTVKISIDQNFSFNVTRISVLQFSLCWRTRVPLSSSKSLWRTCKQRAFISPLHLSTFTTRPFQNSRVERHYLSKQLIIMTP